MIPALKYARLTLEHKFYVFIAGILTGTPIWQLLVHDLSKFSFAEVFAYGRQFFGDKGDPDGFARAWLHHQNLNPHHWEYWLSRSGHAKGTEGSRYVVWGMDHLARIGSNATGEAITSYLPDYLEDADPLEVLTQAAKHMNQIEPVALPIPERYIREMVADWLGASRAYTGSWYIDSWLEKNLPKMNLHRDTKRRVLEIVDQVESKLEKLERFL
jgi:Family of unknown function (DUF5662)